MATSSKQARALGIKLSRERRAGKEIPPPPKGRYSEKTRQKAIRDLEVGRERKKKQKKKKKSSAASRKQSARKRTASKRR